MLASLLGIIPVMVLQCLWYPAVPIAASGKGDEHAQSLRRSTRLTRGSRGRLFTVFAVVFAMNHAALTVVLGFVLPGYTGTWESDQVQAGTLLALLALSGTFSAVTSAQAYFELRRVAAAARETVPGDA